MDAIARRALAMSSALDVADRFGIRVDRPEIINDSNNTVVGLNVRVVAKVATTQLPGRATAIDREFEVLSFLTGSQLPVAGLSDLAPRTIHEANGARMLLLERLDIVDVTPDPRSVLQVIDELHAGLASFDGALPSFLDSFRLARSALADSSQCPTLALVDRAFMTEVALHVEAWFDSPIGHELVLHGDPWIGGNLVSTRHGACLLDFEAACVGPREWDLSSVGHVADEASGVDRALLEQCRALRSYVVAASCWAQPSRAPEVDQAARWHLRLLRDRFGRAG